MPQASCFNHNILLKMWHWDRSMWEKKNRLQQKIYGREHRKGNHKLTNLYFKLNGIDAIPNKQNSIILIACIIICQNLHVLSSSESVVALCTCSSNLFLLNTLFIFFVFVTDDVHIVDIQEHSTWWHMQYLWWDVWYET